MIQPESPSRGNVLLLGAAVLLGSALRLCQVRDQIIVSDEWHALHAVAQTPPRALLSLVTIGASSIPLNLYYRWLLDSVGWTELALRLPSLAAGVCTLFLFPLVVRGLLKPRATVLFAFLIALSPFLTFYSRYCRPYSLLVLLTFVSLVACYRWAVSGRIRDAALFASSGGVAGYLHVPEVRSIALPLALLAALKWLARSEPDRHPIRPSLVAIVLAGVAPTLVLALLLLPGFLEPSQFLTAIVGRARPDATTLRGVIELVSGTAHPLAQGLFVGFALIGFHLVFKRDRLLAGLLFVVVAGSVAMVLLVRPLDGEIAITFTRYVIAIIPVMLIAVATGIDGVLEWAQRRSPLSPGWTRLLVNCTAAGGLAASFWLGPLPRMCSGRNAFTNHKAFQASYGPLTANPYTRRFRHLLSEDGSAAIVPAFYDRLVAETDCDAVIEYPLPVGDVNSPYFLYQARHQKRVIGGYFHAPWARTRGIRPGVVPADWTVDQVLAEVPDPARLRFRNLVNLDDPAAVQASGACFLIVHTDLASELDGTRAQQAPGLGPAYTRRFGQPIFVDALTTVFALR